MRDYTDITILLDRSGSMGSIKAATEEGIREFIRKHKEVPTTKLTLAQFDDNGPSSYGIGSSGTFGRTFVTEVDPVEFVYTARPVSEVPEFHLIPRGGTPLLDALCSVIDKTGVRLRELPESERPKNVVFVIVTDGQENASHTFSRADVRKRIEHQSGMYGWKFIYIGANQDAFAEAASFGIAHDFALQYNATKGGTRAAYAAATTNTLSATNGGTLNAFTNAQRSAAVEDSGTFGGSQDDVFKTTTSGSTK